MSSGLQFLLQAVSDDIGTLARNCLADGNSDIRWLVCD